MGIDDEIILLSAFRYALGRNTYVPQTVANRIEQDWAKLSHSTKDVIRREILEAHHRGALGDDVRAGVWRSLYARIQ